MKLKKRFKSAPPVWQLLLLFTVALLAYFSTTQMYVWQDDHATMFKLIHVNEGAGHFGTGIYDRNSAYRGIFVLLAPIYYLFGTNPAAFYISGIIGYFFASVCIYFLAVTLTGNKKISYASALVFASGYIGAETLWRITNSLHTLHTIIFLCLTLITYKKFIDLSKTSFVKSLIMFFVSLGLFIYTIETGFVRAHGLFLIVLAMELLYNFKFPASLIRMIPFFYIFKGFYLTDNSASYELPLLVKRIFLEQEFNLLLIPLKNLKNIFIPSIWNFSSALFLLLLSGILIWKRNRLLPFLLVLIIANFLVFYIHNPTQVFPSTHRYFLLSLIGYSIFVSTVLVEFFKRKSYFLITVLVLLHLILVNNEQKRFVQEISIPSRNFYQSLKKEIGVLEKDSVVYFDVAEDPQSSSQFANFFGVGSMPDTTAIAWHFGIDRWEFYMPNTFIELLSLMKNEKTDLSKIYTFYYDAKTGLTNTSNMTKNALSKGGALGPITSSDNINYTFSSPLRVNLQIHTSIDRDASLSGDQIDLVHYLNYLESRKDYYDYSKVEAASEWKYREVENIKDQDINTSWMGHRGHWHFEHFDNVVADLGKEKNVGIIKMTYGSKNFVPLEYSYSCSSDKNIWISLGDYKYDPRTESGVVIDRITDSSCRFIKIDIKKTQSDDSPQISELEIVESKFTNINFVSADKLIKNPFQFVMTKNDLNILEAYIRRNGLSVEICFLTDKSTNFNCDKLELKLGTGFYSVIIPAGGRILKSFTIDSPKEVNVIFKGITIKPFTLGELDKAGYIIDYSDN